MTNGESRTDAGEKQRGNARRILAGACTFAAMALLWSCSKNDSAPSNSCQGTLAISPSNLVGSSLPPKTLALTFDDGPGLRTDELSTYLKQQGIRAGFFINGRMIHDNKTQILGQLVADGHVIGNHTQNHVSLTGRSTHTDGLSAADSVLEVQQTDAIIIPFVPSNRFMFRAPYGDFDESSYDAIEGSPMKKYVGPINWDIGDHMGPNQAVDWDCWQAGSDGLILTVQQCGDLYLQEIDAVGHGIILMHDPYFIDDDPQKGGTVDMVKYIVPILKAKGYAFARVDEVPDIATLLPPLVDPTPEAGTPDDAGGLPEATPSGDASTDGGKPDPCPPSPQSEERVGRGESGNLISK
ncbi:polysaccharide deacetylase family protein [Labilithrix luteola]|nr:polysaccharide deacetylase family protein [Labilithrix luteola]